MRKMSAVISRMLLWVYAHKQSKHGLAGCQEFFEHTYKFVPEFCTSRRLPYARHLTAHL